MLEIRPLTLEDYPALVVIKDACWPTQKSTLEEVLAAVAQRRQDLVFLQFLALEDGVPVGVASASQDEWRLESGTYWSNLMVHPQARRRGVGGALYTHLLRETRGVPAEKSGGQYPGRTGRSGKVSRGAKLERA